MFDCHHCLALLGGGQPALEVVLVSSFLQWPAAGSVQCDVGSEPIEQDK